MSLHRFSGRLGIAPTSLFEWELSGSNLIAILDHDCVMVIDFPHFENLKLSPLP